MKKNQPNKGNKVCLFPDPAQSQTAIKARGPAQLKPAIGAATGKSNYVSCPVLCRLPNMITKELTLKLSHNGVTMPRETITWKGETTSVAGKYRRRYIGGESVVDPNGKLYLTKKQYLQAQAVEEQERQAYKASLSGLSTKKPRGISQKPTGLKNLLMSSKDINKTGYTINKTDVNNRVQTMTNAMFAAVKHNAFLGMLTVSFPPCVNEDTAAQALNTWLTALRQKGKKVLRQYLWVSERQKIGTIHYHMLILNRVNIVYANRAMRTVLCNLVRDGVIDYPLTAMKRYNGVDLAKDRVTRQVTNFCDPKSRKALIYYITKYVTKNNERFKHAAWNCSRGFSALFTAITCTMEEFLKMDWSINAAQDPAIQNKWFMFFPWQKDTGPPPEFVQHLAQLNAHVLSCRGFLN